MTSLVAFTGLAGSGKSTACQALLDEGWIRVKFADGLKNMLRAFYRSCGIEDSAYIEARIEGDMKEEPCPFLRGRTPRHAMQTLGTEWGRDCISPDLWVQAWRQRVGTLLSDGVPVVTDDCRFVNEADAVRRLGGRIVRVERPGLSTGAHASEAMAFEPDMVIHNDKTIEQFQHAIVYVFDRTEF